MKELTLGTLISRFIVEGSLWRGLVKELEAMEGGTLQGASFTHSSVASFLIHPRATWSWSGSTRHGLDLTTSSNSQANPTQSKLIWEILQLTFLSQMNLVCVKLTVQDPTCPQNARSELHLAKCSAGLSWPKYMQILVLLDLVFLQQWFL